MSGALRERIPRGIVFLLLLSCLACLALVFASRSQAQNSSASGPGVPAKPANGRPPGDAWAPPDVDAVVPQVTAGAACLLPQVVAGAGRAVQELVENLDRFTATEMVEHQSVNGSGKLGRPQKRKFDYLVSISPFASDAPGGPARNGYLNVQEFRSRAPQPEQFPDRVATEGSPSLVLVFHPLYARDFDMKCEGLGSWRGQPAWQVRFEQRADRQNRMSNVVVGGRMYSIRLRGRGWILADSYQLARIETDLAEPIPRIKLRMQHMAVEYRPVAFPGRQTELWLPSSAELYMDFIDRRFYRKHSFSGFTLFSVDVDEEFRPIASSRR